MSSISKIDNPPHLCYTKCKKSLSDRLVDVFAPDVPKTVEEFSANIKMMKFNVKINRDEYEIIFEKNDLGELEVSSVTLK